MAQKYETLFRVSWWNDKTQVAEPLAEPVDREAELREELRLVDTALRQLNDEMRDFRTVHCLRTNDFNQITSMQSASITGRAAVERDWRGYCARAHQLLVKHNGLLRELAILTVPGFTEEAQR